MLKFGKKMIAAVLVALAAHAKIWTSLTVSGTISAETYPGFVSGSEGTVILLRNNQSI